MLGFVEGTGVGPVSALIGNEQPYITSFRKPAALTGGRKNRKYVKYNLKLWDPIAIGLRGKNGKSKESLFNQLIDI